MPTHYTVTWYNIRKQDTFFHQKHNGRQRIMNITVINVRGQDKQKQLDRVDKILKASFKLCFLSEIVFYLSLIECKTVFYDKS